MDELGATMSCDDFAKSYVLELETGGQSTFI